jgi:hypothetical protein
MVSEGSIKLASASVSVRTCYTADDDDLLACVC